MADLIQQIVSDEAFKQVAELKKELSLLAAQFEKMLKAMNDMGVPPALKNISAAVNAASTEIAEIEKLKNNIITTNAKLSASETIYASELTKAKEALKLKNEQLRAEAKDAQAADGSLNKLRLQLTTLQKYYSSLSAELRNSKLGQTIYADMMKAREGVVLLEQSMGDFKRNVGNYTNSTFQLTQVLRELPAFAYSAQTGIMAISNNLPMLADGFQKVKKETGSTATALRIFGASLLSFQNIFSIGIGLFSLFAPQIINFIKGNKEASDSLKELKNDIENIKKSMLDEISTGKALYDIITNQNLAYNERENAYKKLQSIYPEILKNMTLEQALNERALDTYGGIIASITVLAERKAKLSEYEKLISEQMSLQLKYDQARGKMDASGEFTYTDPVIIDRLKNDLDRVSNMVIAYRNKMEKEAEALSDSFNLMGAYSTKEDPTGKSKLNKQQKIFSVIPPNLSMTDAEFRSLEKYFEEIAKFSKKSMEWYFGNYNVSEAMRKEIEEVMESLVTPTLPDNEANELNKQLMDRAAKRKQEIDDAKLLARQLRQVIREMNQLFSALGNISDAYHEREMQQIEARSRAMQRSFEDREAQLQQLTLSDEEREKRMSALSAQRRAQERQIEAERLEAARKQAIANKLISISQITLSTLIGVQNALAGPPPLPPNPILAGIIASTGALNLSAVLAAPLPQFAKGTDNAPEGYAIVGEKGHELVVEPSGKKWITPAKDTLTYLKAGSKVIPNNELIEMARNSVYSELGGINKPLTTDVYGAALIRTFENLTNDVKELKEVFKEKDMTVSVIGNFDHYMHIKKKIR